MSTDTRRGRLWQAIKRAWRSLLLNRILLVLAIVASGATAVIIGYLVNLYIWGYSGANDPTSLGGLAVFLALLGFAIAGVPALLISTLLWAAYSASKAARARVRAKPTGSPSPPP